MKTFEKHLKTFEKHLSLTLELHYGYTSCSEKLVVLADNGGRHHLPHITDSLVTPGKLRVVLAEMVVTST